MKWRFPEFDFYKGAPKKLYANIVVSDKWTKFHGICLINLHFNVSLWLVGKGDLLDLCKLSIKNKKNKWRSWNIIIIGRTNVTDNYYMSRYRLPSCQFWYLHRNRLAHPGWKRTNVLPSSSLFSITSILHTLWWRTPHSRQLAGFQQWLLIRLSSITSTLQCLLNKNISQTVRARK